MTVTSKHRSCPLVPANGISRSAGQLKITNLYSKLRGKICFKYSRFEAKDSNIRILFGLQNSRIRIRIFEIRGKRFESESNPNIFDHLCFWGMQIATFWVSQRSIVSGMYILAKKFSAWKNYYLQEKLIFHRKFKKNWNWKGYRPSDITFW